MKVTLVLVFTFLHPSFVVTAHFSKHRLNDPGRKKPKPGNKDPSNEVIVYKRIKVEKKKPSPARFCGGGPCNFPSKPMFRGNQPPGWKPGISYLSVEKQKPQDKGRIQGSVTPKRTEFDVANSNLFPREDSEDEQGCSPAPAPDPNDLGIRFNKISFETNGFVPDSEEFGVNLPLDADDYPISSQTAKFLRLSDCWSVIREGDCSRCEIPFCELLDMVGVPIRHPSSDPDDAFWDEFEHVVEAQALRLSSADPSMMMKMPQIWFGYDVHDVAAAVHNEFPSFHHQTLIASLLSDGVQIDRSIIPAQSKVEFLHLEVLLAHLMTWAIAAVGLPNFGLKYHVGRARPEEVAWLILQGRIPVRARIYEMLRSMNITKPADFTAYPEGAPQHPSFPGMHSASSGASLWMLTVMDLTEEQACEVKLVDYAIAFARTVAGVHYESDNIAGLNLAQEVLARKLPDYLATFYGSDPEAVRIKIASLRFNWKDFEDSDCFPISS